MLSLIINPIAGHGKAKQIAERAQQTLNDRGIAFAAYYTERVGHATELAKASATRGDQQVFCFGGDGTAFEVANGLLGGGTALGIIPAGTGNDFVRSLGLPKDPAAALDLLLTATPRAINVCRLNDQVFLNACGVGFDVDVVAACERAKPYVSGMLPYLYGVLHTLFHYRPEPLHIELDGVPQQREFLLCAVANGQYIGGGMHLAPMAQIDDDWLDAILIKPVPRWRIPLLLPKFIDGSFIKLTDIVEHVRCKTVRLSRPGMRLQIDGNLAATDDALVTVAEETLSVLMP